MSTITQDLQSIKTVEDTLTSNKVARFAYTQQAYTDNDADGVTEYNPNQEQNIPVADASVMKVNSSILNLGWRAQASALTRMLMNHFLGRISYNLNKVNDNVSAILSALIAKIGQAEGIASLEANGKVPDAQLGRALANGVASLDENGRIPYSQLPEDALELKGYWDASTNTPTLVDGTGTSGDFYFVDVAGTQDLGSGEQYFAVGDRVLYDGSIWKNVSSGFIRKINNQAPDAQGNKELIVGNNTLPITRGFLGAVFGRLLGRVWHQGTATGAGFNDSRIINSVVHANNLWVCCGNWTIWWSEDGKNWTEGTGLVAGYNYTEVKYVNGLWFATIATHGLLYSENGKNWADTFIGDSSPYMPSYANGLWVCPTSATGIYWSEDGKHWTQSNVAGLPMRPYLVYANDLWVCCSASGMWWSEDGKSWTKGTGANTSYIMQYLVYANGLWVCGSMNRSTTGYGMWWSEDGKSWTNGTGANTSYNMTYLVYANGLWVCGSVEYGMWWSEDGKAWTKGTGNLDDTSILDVVYANGLWVCGSSVKGIWWSEDGKAWTQGFAESRFIQYQVYANGLWVCGGFSGVYWSEDGKNWTRVQGTAKMTHIVYAKGIWVCGSTTNGGAWYADSIEDLITNGTIDLGQAVPLVD